MPEVTDEFRQNKSLLDVKRALRAEGLHVPEVTHEQFFEGLRKLFPRTPDIPRLQSEIMGRVTLHDPHFLEEHPLFGEPFTQKRIRALYGGRKDLVAREGSVKKLVQRIERTFQVRLKHISYHMIDSPRPKELHYAIQQAEEILEGKWEFG
ncbi:MAG: hypothetical protein ACOY3M_03605 [Patescibacteria group bacterium]